MKRSTTAGEHSEVQYSYQIEQNHMRQDEILDLLIAQTDIFTKFYVFH